MNDRERALFNRALALLRALDQEPDDLLPDVPPAPYKHTLRQFEWVVGHSFNRQSGLVTLHGAFADQFVDGEKVSLISKDTGATFNTTVKSLGVIFSGRGARSVNGFKGIAAKTKPTANVDRLVFKEIKSGVFEVSVRRVDPELAGAADKLHRTYRKSIRRRQYHLADFHSINSVIK